MAQFGGGPYVSYNNSSGASITTTFNGGSNAMNAPTGYMVAIERIIVQGFITATSISSITLSINRIEGFGGARTFNLPLKYGGVAIAGGDVLYWEQDFSSRTGVCGLRLDPLVVTPSVVLAIAGVTASFNSETGLTIIYHHEKR